MTKLPYVRFYMSDWLSATRGMKAHEIGVYFTMLALMYERGEPIPADPSRMARQCGCTPKTFEGIARMLVEDGKISLDDGRYWNKRVEKEFTFREENSQSKSDGAKKRWEKAKENNGSGVNDHMHEQCTSNANAHRKPEAIKIIEKEETKVSSKKTVGSRLQNDWFPSQADQEFAAEQGFINGSLKDLSDNFRDYWISVAGQKGVKLDWPATWRNWVRTEAKRKTGPPPRKSAHAERHERAMQVLSESIASRSRGNEPTSENTIDLGAGDWSPFGNA